jgi:hypothetical protein
VRRPTWAALLALLLALLASPAAAQTQAPDLPTYETWVREAFAAAQRGDRLGLEESAARLTAVRAVALPDDSRIRVDNAWLSEALKQSDPDLPMLTDRLGALIDALAQPDSSAPADARARLQELLSRPPFQRAQPQDTTPRWLVDLLGWLGRLLDSLFSPIRRVSAGSGGIVSWLLAILAAVLVLVVIVYLVLGVRRNLVREVSTPDDDPEAHLTARTALDQAGDLARGGDYRTAVRYLYLSALLWLDERGRLRYDRALTNREYLEQVRDSPELRARLAPIVETFDQVWYGHAALDEATFAAYRAQIEALRKE